MRVTHKIEVRFKFANIFFGIIDFIKIVNSTDIAGVLLFILSLVDISLAGNLLIIVIFSGYENFVSKIDVKNKEAVEWWTGKWDKHYPTLRDVSLNVYNQELNADNNYNPIIYKNMKDDSNIEEDPFQNGAFASFVDNVPSKKSGTLMKAVPVKDLPTGKYIDLNFDYNNINTMDKALTDINTAKYIRQAKSFLNSDAHNKYLVLKKMQIYLKKELHHM